MASTHSPSETTVLAELSGHLAEVIGTEDIAADQPLVALGLDSLGIFDLLGDVEVRYGVLLPLAEVMSPHVTLGDVAALIERSCARPSLVVDAIAADRQPSETGDYSTSEEQRQSWFVSQRGRDYNRSFNETVILELTGPVELAALNTALTDLVARHEVLHSVFAPDGTGQAASAPGPAITTLDLRAVAEPERSTELVAFTGRGAELEFDLASGPFYRIETAVLADDQVRVAMTAHDLVADGASYQVLVEELAVLYNGASGAGPAAQLAPPTPYRAHVRAQQDYARSQDHAADGEFWRDQYPDGFSPLRWPAGSTGLDGTPGEVVELFPTALVAAIETRARELGCTPFTLYLAAFALALHHTSGQERLTLAVPVRLPAVPQSADVVGNCVSTIAVDSERLARDTVGSYVARLARRLADGFQHARYPLADLARVVGAPAEGVMQLPVFNQVPIRRTPVFHGLTARVVPAPRVAAPGDWQTALRPVEAGLECVVTRGANSIGAAAARALVELTRAGLAGLATIDAAAPLGTATPAPVRPDRTPAVGSTLLDLFGAHVRTTPDATAVIDDEGSLTFAELDARAEHLAGRLQATGIGTENVVAIALDRSIDLIVAVLGVWRAGGAILMINVDDPHARQAQIVADARPAALVTAECMRPRLRPLGLPLTLVDDGVTAPDRRPLGPVHPDALAYVVYTSGSSGAPKGVMGTHSGLLSTFEGWRRLLDLTAGRIHLQMANASFDGFLGEIIRALGSGGVLLVCARETMLDPERLSALITDRRVTVADFVPLVLRRLVAHTVETGSAALAGVDVVIVGSDLVHTAELRTVRGLIAADGRVINCYGVTEGTIDSTVAEYAWDDENHSNALIGVPMAGVDVHVLADDLTPVAVGEAGVLHLGGVGLSRGYLGDPAKTAAAFGPDPFGSTPGARLYRTGDLVRWSTTPAGRQLEYVGRADAQLKIRGYRVELGEIEAALRRLPGVADAAATGAGPVEQRHLEAFVVCLDESKSGQWFGQLRRHLPHYMLPDRLTIVPALVTNANGKVDRDALGTVPGRLVPRTTYAVPTDPGTAGDREQSPEQGVVERLSAVWATALHLEAGQVPADGDFFALGGDSLLLMRVVGAIAQEWNVDVTVRDFIDHPTVRELAGVIAAAPPRPATDPRPAIRRVERRPLPTATTTEGEAQRP